MNSSLMNLNELLVAEGSMEEMGAIRRMGWRPTYGRKQVDRAVALEIVGRSPDSGRLWPRMDRAPML